MGNISDYEPVVQLSTRRAGDAIETKVRDNGTGVTVEVREKMFNPLFTTKGLSEEPGLGLVHDVLADYVVRSVSTRRKTTAQN